MPQPQPHQQPHGYVPPNPHGYQPVPHNPYPPGNNYPPSGPVVTQPQAVGDHSESFIFNNLFFVCNFPIVL